MKPTVQALASLVLTTASVAAMSSLLSAQVIPVGPFTGQLSENFDSQPVGGYTCNPTPIFSSQATVCNVGSPDEVFFSLGWVGGTALCSIWGMGSSGSAAFLNDTFLLRISGLPGIKPGLCVKGSVTLGGGLGTPVGDGLLCTNPQLRSQVILSDAAGGVVMDNWRGSPFSAYPGVANVGAPTFYQWWYRDTGNPCSGLGFNFTNGVEVVWN